MTTNELRIAVVGAGIGGLTLAAALGRAGLRCEVFEQAPRLAEVGAGIQIAPNATRLLHRLGLADHLRKHAVAPQAIQMSRWNDGATIMRTPLGAECEQLYGAPYYTVHRADLHTGLLELLPPGVVRLGERCVRIDERADEVELVLDSGRRHTADVVVGADGIHSVVRDQLVADQPRFSGQTIYRGLVPAERVPFLLTEPAVRLWLGPDQHCVAYPVSRATMVSFGATTPAQDWRTESWSASGRVEDLQLAYGGWHPDVLRLIAAADEVSRWALHDRDTITTWSTDRVTLLGDAAHPMLPFLAQGANQAAEDAVVLAACLRDAGRDGVGAALRRYESLRKPRTEEIHQRSRANKQALHLDDGEQQRRRDEELAGAASLRSQEWLYGHDAEAL